MAIVTPKIRALIQERDQGILDGQAVVAGLLAEVKRQVMAEIQATPEDTVSGARIRAMLPKIQADIDRFAAQAKNALSGQLDTMWTAGGDLPFAAAQAGGQIGFATGYVPRTVLESLKEFTAFRIDGLSEDMMSKIQGELSLGLLGQQTPFQVARNIAGTLESPGIFKSIEARAQTVTELEMGRAYSYATYKGIRQAAATVPGMMGEWWHAGHPMRARISHLALDGVRKPAGEPFMSNGYALRFPRDPKAPIQEVIHCGCDLVPYHPDWG